VARPVCFLCNKKWVRMRFSMLLKYAILECFWYASGTDLGQRWETKCINIYKKDSSKDTVGVSTKITKRMSLGVPGGGGVAKSVFCVFLRSGARVSQGVPRAIPSTNL